MKKLMLITFSMLFSLINAVTLQDVYKGKTSRDDAVNFKSASENSTGVNLKFK